MIFIGRFMSRTNFMQVLASSCAEASRCCGLAEVFFGGEPHEAAPVDDRLILWVGRIVIRRHLLGRTFELARSVTVRPDNLPQLQAAAGLDDHLGRSLGDFGLLVFDPAQLSHLAVPNQH